jgi:branched-chain amino acid transport system permease protein
MYAVGAYTTVITTQYLINDIALCVLLASVAGLIIGLLSGIPGLRLGGWNLAVSSFFLILLVPDVLNMTQRYTGGFQGANGIPLPNLLGHNLGNQGYVAFVVIVTSLWLGLLRNLIVSRTGDSFSVLRESPVLASSLGISVYTTKLKAYAISGLPAAVAGSMFAYLDGFVSPDDFGLTLAIAVLAATILGGSRSIYGAILGAALLQLGPMSTTSFGNYAFVAYGAFLIVAGVLFPAGFAGLARLAVSKVRTAREAPGTSSAPRTAADLPPMPGQRLTIQGVSKSFGGVAALTDVGFTVEPGEVVALIGPNGSGKTTLLNVISGYYREDRGSVHIGDLDVTRLSPHRIAAAGAARTFQTPMIPALSVRRSVRVARTKQSPVSIIHTMLRLPKFIGTQRNDAEIIDAILNAVGLGRLADADAQSLPLGTRRLLELARALATDPAVLLLDEVASGLDEGDVAKLSAVIRRMQAAGATVVLVEHNFGLVRALSDRVVVLSRGKVVLVDTPDVVAKHPEVLEHYLGQKPSAARLAAGTLAEDQ